MQHHHNDIAEREHLVAGGGRAGWWLAVLLIVAVGPLVHDYRAQQASRYLLTAAVWDHHTLSLDPYAALDPPVLGMDRAVRDGHTYSDKAPLQPLLAVPFYALYRAAGGEPAEERRIEGNLGLWWVTLWLATVPAALLAVAMYRQATRIDVVEAGAAAASLTFGSLLLPFAALLFGHSLAALFVFVAFAMALRDGSSRTLVAAGAAIGAAVATEYTTALLLFVLGVVVVRLHGIRRLGWVVAGGLPFALLVGAYHWAVFGSPLAHPYRFSAFTEVPSQARGFFSMFSGVRIGNLVELFVDGRGFVAATPIVALALVGAWWSRRDPKAGRHAWVGLAAFVVMMLIPLMWSNPWGGDSPGARYMTPAIPLLVVGVAAVWRRLPVLARGAAAVSVLTMVLATFTDPLRSDEASVSIGSWLRLAIDGEWAPTVFSLTWGIPGALVHLVLIGAAAWGLRRALADSLTGIATA